jgi:hypothetical protein
MSVLIELTKLTANVGKLISDTREWKANIVSDIKTLFDWKNNFINEIPSFNIYFTTASFAKVENWTPVTSLINQENHLFDVVDNYKIIFKKKGVYEIKVQVFTRFNDIGNDFTRLGFAGGKYTIVGTALEDNWRCTRLSKVRKMTVNEAEYLVFLHGRFGTWRDRGVCYIQVTRIGD